METQRISIAELACDPANVRAHDAKNLDAIKGSLQRFGQQKPIVVDEKGIVIAGNGTLTAARALGWDAINIVRTELAGAEATAYAIADNRTAELAEWDDEALAKQLSALQIEDEALVEAAGFSEAELTALVDEVTGITEGNTDPDEVPEMPGEPTAQPGQIWQLGNHRLMCGDSTSAEDVAALMDGERASMLHTDPPYGVDYEGVLNDSLKAEKFEEFLLLAFQRAFDSLEPSSNVYIWHADITALEFIKCFRSAGFKQARPPTIQWIKPSLVMSQGDYHSQNEPCLYGWKEGSGRIRVKDRKQTTLWECGRTNESKIHPTMKPVELCARAIKNSSEKNAAVLDLFLGSGSTLIACEQTGRKCYGMELSPAYCDVIIRRWEDFTGQTAELVDG